MYNNKPKRAVIPAPVGLTQDQMTNTVDAYSKHFASKLDINTILTARKAVYATIINGTNNQGTTLEQQVGSANAQAMTEQILGNLTASIAKVPIDGIAIDTATYQA